MKGFVAHTIIYVYNNLSSYIYMSAYFKGMAIVGERGKEERRGEEQGGRERKGRKEIHLTRL